MFCKFEEAQAPFNKLDPPFNSVWFTSNMSWSSVYHFLFYFDSPGLYIFFSFLWICFLLLLGFLIACPCCATSWLFSPGFPCHLLEIVPGFASLWSQQLVTSLTSVNAGILASLQGRVSTSPAHWAFGVFPGCVTAGLPSLKYQCPINKVWS